MSAHYPTPQDLPAAYEAMVQLLLERERLSLDYLAALQFSDEKFWEWRRDNWKKFARNYLALLQNCRPITYADYRNSVTILSPSLGVIGPCRLVTGWLLESTHQLQREAEDAAALALFAEVDAFDVPAPAPMEAVAVLASALDLEPEPEPLAPLPPIVDEPLFSFDEYHSAPDFAGLFLAPTARVEEVEQLVQGLFSWNGEAFGEDNPTLGELYCRKRALLLGRAPAPTAAAAPAIDASRKAAMELRRLNRARLQALRPSVAAALNSPPLLRNPFTS